MQMQAPSSRCMGGRRAPSSSGASSLRPCMPLSPTGRAAGVGPEPLVASFSRRDDGASASCGPLSRRDALLAAVPAALLWLPHGRALAGAAEDAAGLSLLQQKDTEDGGGASQEAKQYPKAYQTVVRNIVNNLRDTIDAEKSGATELEVRRKADPVKEGAREFLRKWDDDVRVKGSVSHLEIKAVLSELGNFYKANGQRSRLSEDVAGRILERLGRAEGDLSAPDKEKVLGLF